MSSRCLFGLILVAACGATAPVREVADALSARAGTDAAGREAHWRAILADYLDRSENRCLPPSELVLAAPAGAFAPRRVAGRMPHYDFFDGPVRYRVGADAGHWRVELAIAIEAEIGGTLELPDCALGEALEGPVVCEGVAYEDAPGLEACPESGRFEAPATRRNLELLLARWSTEIEAYYNRDAERYDLPVRYDFSFFLADRPTAAPVDLVLSLRPTCGRTPYFVAMRSGWSISVLAHEVGHYLGLLDEYEALSGITSLYPKTPFAGSEKSRMGVSMKRDTRLLPIHHYLVLRPIHCEAAASDAFEAILAPRAP